MSEEISLTAQELKNQIFHNLKERGLIDSLKSHLRKKIVTHLKTFGGDQTFTKIKENSKESCLIQYVVNSLVADHLDKSKYDYTHSVFLPESGTFKEKSFEIKEILDLLKINSQSNLYAKLNNSEINSTQGFLWNFLNHISQNGHSQCDISVQTDLEHYSFANSLDEKFKLLDQQYACHENEVHAASIEDRILAYQHQLEERSNNELKFELARFKDTELVKMRLEEKEKMNLEISKIRKESDKNYRAKLEALMEREKNLSDQYKKQNDIQEKELFVKRQALLSEIEIVRQKEAEVRHLKEMHDRELQFSESQLKSRENILSQKETTFLHKDLDFDKTLHEKLSEFKLEHEKQFLQRNRDLEFREMKSREELRRLDQELKDIDKTKQELRDTKSRLQSVEIELEHKKHELIGCHKEIEGFNNKTQDIASYQIIKEENAILKKELEVAKSRNSELLKENIIERRKIESLLREMGDLRHKPSAEIMLMENELDQLRSQLKQEKALSAHRSNQANQHLQDEISRNSNLLKQLEKQGLNQRLIDGEVTNLRQQLLNNKTALENEVGRKVHSREFIISPSSQFDVSICKPVSTVYTSESHSENVSISLDLIEETKHRLNNLELEANNLEHNYKDFHLRAASAKTLQPDPSDFLRVDAINKKSISKSANHPTTTLLDCATVEKSTLSDRTDVADFSDSQDNLKNVEFVEQNELKKGLNSNVDLVKPDNMSSDLSEKNVQSHQTITSVPQPILQPKLNLDSAWKQNVSTPNQQSTNASAKFKQHEEENSSHNKKPLTEDPEMVHITKPEKNENITDFSTPRKSKQGSNFDFEHSEKSRKVVVDTKSSESTSNQYIKSTAKQALSKFELQSDSDHSAGSDSKNSDHKCKEDSEDSFVW